MHKATGWLKAASLFTGLAVSAGAGATTGYFQLGYGAKNLGLAGAVASNPQDSMAAAVNPAGMGLVGERVDAGITMFSPIREASINTKAFGATYNVQDESRRNLFFVPSLGYTSQINDRMFWGISMYGNGGLNTTYDRNIYDETAAVAGAFAQGGPIAASMLPKGTTTNDLGLPTENVGTLGVDLAQGIIAPTLTFKVHERHTLGASLLVGIQRFSARGLGNFQCFTQTGQSIPAGAASCAASGGAISATPSDNLTNNGNDWSYGAGMRLGWIGNLSDHWSLGAAAASKVYMTEFDDYSELFAEDGDFDIPANVSLGVTFRPSSQLSLSFDYQRIFYEGVKSISNPGPGVGLTIPPGSGLLGTDDGLGFGWEDISVYRIAADYQHNREWNFRAGFSYNDAPIPEDQLTFNILAPATPRIHGTLGFTYRPNSNSEWSFAYMHAFKESVKTRQTAFGVPGEIEMYQNAFDLSYAYKF